MANLTHPTRLLAATAATLVLVLATLAPAGAQDAGAGLVCEPAAPQPGDTLECEAGGLEEDAAFDWKATFTMAGGEPDEELTGDGTVDGGGEAHFDLTVPDDAEGDLEVVVESDGEMSPDGDYTFTGSVAPPEEGNGEENDTTTTTAFDDTTTTTAFEETTTTTEDDSETDDSGFDDAETSETDDVAGTAVETGPQVDVVPAGGVATGIGPPDDDARSAVAAAVLLALVASAVTLLALVRRSAGGRAT